MEVTPLGTVHVFVPEVKVTMQLFPLLVDVAPVVVSTSATQGALPTVAAFALGAVTTEIAESVETAKTKGKNEETKR